MINITTNTECSIDIVLDQITSINLVSNTSLNININIFGNKQPVTENYVIDKIEKRIDPENLRQDQNIDTPSERNFSVTLEDVDGSVEYYIKNVIKPSILDGNEIYEVPIMYSNPERWVSMRNIGHYKDNKGKLVYPLIMYSRTGFLKNENIQFPRLKELYYISSKKWGVKNKYDKFSVYNKKNDRVNNTWENKTDEYSLTSMPNHVVVNYEFIIWTAFVQHSNEIIEKILYTDTQYWGDPGKFRFRVQIEQFDTPVEMDVENQRLIRTTFGMTLYAYLLPEYMFGIPTTKVGLSPKKVLINYKENY